jgi:sugar phosphate isomerase/epimerase
LTNDRQQTLTIDIAVSGAFLTRRWEDPDNWMRLTKEAGYDCHSFCGDVLDPFFSGDRSYQIETAKAVKAAAANHGVTIVDYYTGMATHRFHGLSHSDERVRKRMFEWCVNAFELAHEMGSEIWGGHVDAFSVEVLDDEKETEKAWNRLIGEFRALSVEAKKRGLNAIYSEQMYIPSEKPWTLAEMERFLLECNEGNENGVPVRVALDTGHVAGGHYGLTGEDLDYKIWLRRFAAHSKIIHIQQTTPDHSNHWPFTISYNERGYIDIDTVLEEIVDSHEEYHCSKIARVLPPENKVILVAEIIPGSTCPETKLLDELHMTAEYLRHYIPKGGLTVTVGESS